MPLACPFRTRRRDDSVNLGILDINNHLVIPPISRYPDHAWQSPRGGIENAGFLSVCVHRPKRCFCSMKSAGNSSILDVEELLRRAAEQVKRVIDYQILSIMLYDEDQKIFVIVWMLSMASGCKENCASLPARNRWCAATLREPVHPDVSATRDI
jgi:hypothetical protein